MAMANSKCSACVICGNEVSKRQSLFYMKQGRACRSHQEVIDYVKSREELVEPIKEKVVVKESEVKEIDVECKNTPN